MFSADWTETKTLSQAQIQWLEIWCGLQLSHEYLTSSHKLLQASIYRLQLSVWVTHGTERVIVLSKILAFSKSFHYCCLLLAASMGLQQSNNTGQGSAVTTILSKPRMPFHVRNMMLMMFYLNVTLLDITSCGMRWCLVYTNDVLQCLHSSAYVVTLFKYLTIIRRRRSEYSLSLRGIIVLV